MTLMTHDTHDLLPKFIDEIFCVFANYQYLCIYKVNKVSMITKNLILRSMKAAAALLLTVTIAAGLSSCVKEDNSVINNEEPADVTGTWYAEYDYEGVAGEGEHAKAFVKVALYGALKEKGSGFWVCILVDVDGKAVDLEDTFLGASCDYTVTKDGKVDIKLTGSSSAVTLYPSWTMDYRNGHLVGKVRDDFSCTMSPITDEQAEQVNVWLRQLGLGYSDEPVGLDTSVRNVDLSTLTANYRAVESDVLTGKMPLNEYGRPMYSIKIVNGSHITLDNATIWGVEENDSIDMNSPLFPAIECEGDATITIKGINNLSGAWAYPIIFVPKDKTLTIVDPSKDPLEKAQPNQLIVKNIGWGAAIGGGFITYVCADYCVFAYCSKEPKEVMKISEFIKANYVSLNPAIDWNFSGFQTYDGYDDWFDGFGIPRVRRIGNELHI